MTPAAAGRGLSCTAAPGAGGSRCTACQALCAPRQRRRVGVATSPLRTRVCVCARAAWCKARAAAAERCLLERAVHTLPVFLPSACVQRTCCCLFLWQQQTVRQGLCVWVFDPPCSFSSARTQAASVHCGPCQVRRQEEEGAGGRGWCICQPSLIPLPLACIEVADPCLPPPRHTIAAAVRRVPIHTIIIHSAP